MEISFSSFSNTIEYMKIGNSKDKASGNKVAPIIFNRAYIYTLLDTTTGISYTADTILTSFVIFLINELVTKSSNFIVPSFT